MIVSIKKRKPLFFKNEYGKFVSIINPFKFNVMKRLFFSVACAIALTMGVSGCAVVGQGMLYNDTVEPNQVTANSLGSKVGEAKITNYLGAVALGDAGVQKAAKDAGITKISHIDKKVWSILGLYSVTTYTVYGN